MESKFEKIKPSEADDIIKEYEEEVKDQINSSDFDYTDPRLMMKKQDWDEFSSPVINKHPSMMRIRSSIENSNMNSFISSPKNDDYFTKNPKIVWGKSLLCANTTSIIINQVSITIIRFRFRRQWSGKC